MQKAPVLKSSGLQPLKETTEEVHVFGRNLEDRVVTTNDQEDEEQQQQNQQQQQPQSSDLNSQQLEGDVDIKKRKFEAITGEEEEETIFQGDFKLYGWDLASSNWIEKGRGQLKLNDTLASECPESRLIMRISGTLRIVLNVAIRKNFRIISSSKTNLRFTDGQNMWAVSGGTADKLAEAVEPRIQIVRQPAEVGDRNADQDEQSIKKTKKHEEQDGGIAKNVSEEDKTKLESSTDQPINSVDENNHKPGSQEANQVKHPSQDSEKSASSPQHHRQPESSDEASKKEHTGSPEHKADSENADSSELKDEDAVNEGENDKHKQGEDAEKTSKDK